MESETNVLLELLTSLRCKVVKFRTEREEYGVDVGVVLTAKQGVFVSKS